MWDSQSKKLGPDPKKWDSRSKKLTKKTKNEIVEGRGDDDLNTRSAEQYIIRQRSVCASRTKVGKITRQLAHTLLWQIYNFVKKSCFSGTQKSAIVEARSYNNKRPATARDAKT